MERFTDLIPGSPINGQIIGADGGKLNICQTDKNGYSIYLLERGVDFTHQGHFLQVGKIPGGHQWLIHLSVVVQQMEILINSTLDYLLEKNLAFILPADKNHHKELLNGRYGFFNIGKIITVCLDDATQAESIVLKLIELTKGLKGPEIPGGIRLGDCLAVFYGALFDIPDEVESGKYHSLYGFNANNYIREVLTAQMISWPFSSILKLKKIKPSRIVNRQYLPVQLLKKDAKGNVLKCIRLGQLYNMQWCVLKQGRLYQCYDHNGRDSYDRLKWQHELHTLLEDRIRLPKVLEYFEFGRSAYLALEFIEGVTLTEKVVAVQNGIIWFDLLLETKLEIVAYLLQVAELLKSFHMAGLVHRDVTPANFMVNNHGNLVPIDIELAYSLALSKPTPPFHLGTEGYMSPQQIKEDLPRNEDDIYAFGALMVRLFTGLLPNKFSLDNPGQLFKDLLYFLSSDRMAILICKCLATERSVRPDIMTINKELNDYTICLISADSYKLQVSNSILQTDKIASVIQKAIGALEHPDMLGPDSQWFTKTVETNYFLPADRNENCRKPGFSSGTAGILFLLFQAEKLGYKINRDGKLISQNIDYLIHISERTENLYPGLSQGSYGMAAALSSLSHLPPGINDKTCSNVIRDLLSVPTSALNLANGIAGQGVCMLYCMRRDSGLAFNAELSAIVSILIKAQNKDGSWFVKREERQSAGVKMTGFSYGISGITCFLIAYYNFSGDQQVKNAIFKSLGWLIRQRKQKNGHGLWWVNPDNSTVDPWLDYGFSGIALVFIKACVAFSEPVYREVAESALSAHPMYISSNNYSLGNGLSGLGEIYLEAFRVFGSETWLDRASHIANLFLHSYKMKHENAVYWLDENFTRPTADLMTGNSGIIHFLMRYCHPEQLDFPVPSN